MKPLQKFMVLQTAVELTPRKAIIKRLQVKPSHHIIPISLSSIWQVPKLLLLEENKKRSRIFRTMTSFVLERLVHDEYSYDVWFEPNGLPPSHLVSYQQRDLPALPLVSPLHFQISCTPLGFLHPYLQEPCKIFHSVLHGNIQMRTAQDKSFFPKARISPKKWNVMQTIMWKTKQ